MRPGVRGPSACAGRACLARPGALGHSSPGAPSSPFARWAPLCTAPIMAWNGWGGWQRGWGGGGGGRGGWEREAWQSNSYSTTAGRGKGGSKKGGGNKPFWRQFVDPSDDPEVIKWCRTRIQQFLDSGETTQDGCAERVVEFEL